MSDTLQIGKNAFLRQGKTYVCGILNVTPDSFSDGGQFAEMDAALFQTEKMCREGMDLLDIGGESTRPGHTPVSAKEEMDRVLPVIEAVKKRFDVPISLDTSKSEVAAAGIEAGADLINDVWGLKADPNMAGVIAGAGVPCCFMHNRKEAVYTDFRKEVYADLRESLQIAEAAGIAKEQMIADPGIGFAKSYEQNLEMLHHLDEMKTLGCPFLLGASRKSVIGLTLDLPVTERLEGTLVTTVLAVLAGAMFVRVHDVEANVRAVKMTEAILKEQ